MTTGGNVWLFGIIGLVFIAKSNGVKTAESHPMLASLLKTANAAVSNRKEVNVIKKPDVKPPITRGALMTDAMCGLCKDQQDLACIKRHCVQPGHVIAPRIPPKVRSTPTRGIVKPPMNIGTKTPAVSCSLCYRTNDPECKRKHCRQHIPKHQKSPMFPKDASQIGTHIPKHQTSPTFPKDASQIGTHIPKHQTSPMFPKDVPQIGSMTVFGVIAAQALCSRCRQLNDLVCIERHCMNIEETSVSSTQQKGSTTLFTDQSITTGHHFKPISPNKFHPSSNIQEGQQQSFTGNIGHKPFQSPGPVLPQPVLNPPQKISTDEQVHVPPSTGVKLPPKETQRVPADRESFVPLFEGPTKPQSGHIIEHSDLPVQPSFPSMPPVALPSNNVEGNMVQPPDNNVPQRGNDRTFRPIILPPRSQPSRVDSDNFQPQSTDSGSVVWGDNGSQRLPIEITKSELVGPIIQGIEPQQQQRDRINARPSNSNERNAVETVQNAGSVGTFVPIERISVFNDNQNIQQSETHDGAQGIPIEIGNIESFRPIPRDVEPHQQQQNRINIQPPNSNQRNAVETFLNSDVTGTSSSNEGIPMSSDNQNNHRPAPQEFIPFNAINEIPVEPRTDTVGPPNQEHVPGTDGRGVQAVLSDTVVQLPEETRANQGMQEQPPQSTNTGESNQANITQVFEEFFPIGFIESNNQITGPQNEDIPVANNIFAPFEASQSSATATGDGIHEGSHSQIVETGSQTASDIPTQADSASLNLQANSQQHIASNQEQGLSGVIPDDLTMLITSPFGVNPQELRDILAVRNTNFLNLGPGIPTTEPHITSTIGDSAPSFEIQNAAPGDHLPGDQPLQSNNDNVNSVVEFIDGGSNEGILFDSASNLPPEQSFETTTLMPTISPVRRQELSEISRQFLQGFRAKR